jgi:type I restriction-modification system DNA methylase subunit
MYGQGSTAVRDAVNKYGASSFALYILEKAVPFDEAGVYESKWYYEIAKGHKMYNKIAPSWKSMPAKYAKYASFLKRQYDKDLRKIWHEIYETLTQNNMEAGKKEQAKYTPSEVCALLQKTFGG